MNKNAKNNKDREEYLENKFNVLQQNQEEELLLDFDKCIDENKNPFQIKFLNKKFELPRQMPFSFATFFFRHCYKKNNGKITVDVPEDKILRFIELMFGQEMLKALESNPKVGINDVFDKLAVKVLDEWGYGVKGKTEGQTEKKI